MPEAFEIDIFDDALVLGLLPELAVSRTEPRERDLLLGTATAGQPSSTLGAGRMTLSAEEMVELRLYDDQAEFRPGQIDDRVDLIHSPLNAKIIAVNADKTYDATAYMDPAIRVSGQVPYSRQIDPDVITTTLAVVGDPCTIMVLPNGVRYLWDVQETLDLDEACVPGDSTSSSSTTSNYASVYAVGNATETVITTMGVAVRFVSFTDNGPSSGLFTPRYDKSRIDIEAAGDYFIMMSATVNSVGGTASRFEMTIRSRSGNVLVPGVHVDRNIAGGGGASGSVSMSGIATLSAGDAIEVWIENETSNVNYIIEDINLTVKDA